MAKAKQINAESVAQLVSFLEENKSDDVSLSDIMSLAEVMAGSLDASVKSANKTIYGEFTAIANEISSMKREIAGLCPREMRHSAIPEAGRELDAVVEATESATNTIMASAEEIMGADPSEADAYQALVNDEVIKIFEACSFQDITGQRIAKVVRALEVIDNRVSTFIEKLKVEDLEDEVREETEEERRQRELILHGPQHHGEGVNQSEVDAMLAELGFGDENPANENKSSQSDIDDLFG